MKRARPDLETAVAFLCTRVSCSTLSDWKKLKRVLKYAEGTINDERVIGASSLKNIFMFIDASYAIYDNMRGVTGGCMLMGIGTFHARSSKQKLNTKSSTETELVGVSEYLPFNIWAINFLAEQGIDMRNNILMQDNQGAILMEKNGRNSCTGNSRHINIRYFFMKDKVDKDELRVEYCPTYLMIADYFTKPLQGRLFKLFRDVIMGYRPLDDIINEIPMKERVGNKIENRIVSRNNNETNTKLIGISREKIKSDALGRLATTKGKIVKQVKWKDQKGQEQSNELG